MTEIIETIETETNRKIKSIETISNSCVVEVTFYDSDKCEYFMMVPRLN